MVMPLSVNPKPEINWASPPDGVSRFCRTTVAVVPLVVIVAFASTVPSPLPGPVNVTVYTFARQLAVQIARPAVSILKS